jgi:hypothetical protein
MKRNSILVLSGLLAAGVVAGCSAAPTTSVPSLAGATATAAGHATNAQALHAAAQCIREHGVPAYPDPVIAPDGSVYTDQRSVQDVSQDSKTLFDQIRAACQSLFSAANFNPGNEPKATPALVQAGVRAAQCMRAHGVPNYRDPTASTPFTPGHGFGLTLDQLPAGGKASPVMQQAQRACIAQINAELSASKLTSLSHG